MLHVALMWMFRVLDCVPKKTYKFPIYYKRSALVICDAVLPAANKIK